MSGLTPTSTTTDKPSPWWFSLRGAVLLALLICALRLIYIFFISPYELDGDEAQYWEWSRRLQLSYYTKGPGVAWTIAAFTALFGHTEGGVRTAAVLSSCIMMITLARLAYDVGGRSNKAAFYTAALYTLTPAYFAASQFMTIDMPFFMCMALGCLLAFHAVKATREGRGGWVTWALLGLVIGVGFDYKYTILLMLPGLLIFLAVQRKTMPLNAALFARLGLMLVVFLLAISPVIIWNHREGWPTVSHLLGHVHMPGGDSHTRKSWSYDPTWTLEGLAVQLGIVGIPVMLLLILSVRWAWRQRRDDAAAWRDHLLLILLGLPTLVFYFGVSLLSDIEGNWPLAGYIPLLPLAGIALAVHMPLFHAKAAAWRALPEPRPRAGLLRKRPQTIWQVAWHVAIAWGLVAAVAIPAAPFAKDLPIAKNISGFDRVTGQADEAKKLDLLRRQLTEQLGQEPAILAYKYRTTAAYAFYLPDRPTLVYCGQHYFGARRSPYDYFEDTNLRDPALLGRPFILIGRSAQGWQRVFRFDRVDVIDADRQWFLGHNYQGPADPPTP